jgi:hypothetical protein
MGKNFVLFTGYRYLRKTWFKSNQNSDLHWIRIRIRIKCWLRIRIYTVINVDPKHWFSQYGMLVWVPVVNKRILVAPPACTGINNTKNALIVPSSLIWTCFYGSATGFFVNASPHTNTGTGSIQFYCASYFTVFSRIILVFPLLFTKSVSLLRIRDVLSRIRIRPLLHLGFGSRIRGVKKHRIRPIFV